VGKTNEFSKPAASHSQVVRNAVKLGLAGLIALFCAQMLRVPDDNWAILTVFVLMDAKYVGALAFKAIMRLTGTILGALIGICLASDYASTPAIFLSGFFIVMVFAGYKVGQVGLRQVPYAYYLLGLTTLTIVSSGVTDPALAWQTGLDRKEDDRALTEMDYAFQQMRDRNLLVNLPTDASLRVLDLVDRYHGSADALAQCGEKLHALRIERYWGDYAL
jgi:hypothetical protein